jgi:hypothetical protein
VAKPIAPRVAAEGTPQLLLRKVAPGTPSTLFFDTMLAYQKRDIQLAKERSQQLMRVSGDNPMALQLAGAVELEARSLLQAEAYLAKSLQIAPAVTLTRRLLTTVYMRSGQSAKALATAQPFIKEADKLDETWCLYDGQLIDDELYLELGKFATGVRILVLSLKQIDAAEEALEIRRNGGAAEERRVKELEEELEEELAEERDEVLADELEDLEEELDTLWGAEEKVLEHNHRLEFLQDMVHQEEAGEILQEEEVEEDKLQ